MKIATYVERYQIGQRCLIFSMTESFPFLIVLSLSPHQSHCLKLTWVVPLIGGKNPGLAFRGLRVPCVGPIDLICFFTAALLFKSEFVR